MIATRWPLVPAMGTIVPESSTRHLLASESKDPSTVLFGATRRRVLAWLFNHPDQRFYLRQLARASGAAVGAVQRELRMLVDAGIVRRTIDGRQVYLQVNRESPVFPELRALLLKTVGPVEVVREALVPIGDRIDAALIFGSAARGQLRSDSDVDVLVVGDVPFGTVAEALSSAQERLGRDVNPTVYPPAEFARKVRQRNHFLATLLREPQLFVLGGPDELARLGAERMAHAARGQRRGNPRPARRRRPRPRGQRRTRP